MSHRENITTAVKDIFEIDEVDPDILNAMSVLLVDNGQPLLIHKVVKAYRFAQCEKMLFKLGVVLKEEGVILVVKKAGYDPDYFIDAYLALAEADAPLCDCPCHDKNAKYAMMHCMPCCNYGDDTFTSLILART